MSFSAGYLMMLCTGNPGEGKSDEDWNKVPNVGYYGSIVADSRIVCKCRSQSKSWFQQNNL
jgi:hypothetical protein